MSQNTEESGLVLEQTKQQNHSLSGGRAEEAALNALLGNVNTPEFSTDPEGTPGPFSAPDTNLVPSKAAQRAARPVPRKAPPGQGLIEHTPQVTRQVARQVAPQVAAPVRTMENFVFMTGRLRRGKDHVMNHFGYTIYAFADPLYALCSYFFGECDKKQPGVRKFLQLVGQWGRGVINEQYPLTPARAMFITMIRTLSDQLPNNLHVNWAKFGFNEDIWNDALISRVAVSQSVNRAGVSGCRFENEYKKLEANGFTHYHVMCSPETWAKRLAMVGLKPNSPEVNDYSEKLAIALDNDAMQSIKIKPQGPKLRVIWNDEFVRCPSPRFYTLNELA